MPDIIPFEVRNEHTEAEQLGAEITELCGYIYAATCHLLDLIRTFDERRYWAQMGFQSCAHWLNFHCGIGLNAARERLRVAHTLPAMPRIHRAFSEGRISFSKVRAVTRVPDPSNEEFLLNICTHGTAQQVERLISKYRRAKMFQEVDFCIDQYARREATWRYADDGSIVITARLTPDQGEVVLQALEKAIDISELSEETPVAQRRADALTDVAETFLNNSENGGSSADRFQVVVHRKEENEDHFIANGPDVTAVTWERVACDCSKIEITECKHGNPREVSRKSRTIPVAIRRALWARDRGCRFPGCTHTRHCDGHHIRHWIDGGEHSLDNLVLLCRHHHRLVHEGGFEVQTDGTEIWFEDRRGERMKRYATLPGITLEETMATMYRRFEDIEVHGCSTKYFAGDEMDYDYAVSVMFPTTY